MKEEYEILDSHEIDNVTCIFLQHKKTGLKICCHQCDTDLPGFSFRFNTPVEDPYLGTSHVLEHCVLQESRNYDVDFLLLKDFSFCSDFNGITEIDNTEYYFYSPLESECFKIIPILADYLFFPQLSEEALMQENYRVEFSPDMDKRKHEMCGVIYNEMKTHSADKCFFGGINYRLHELNLEKLRDYHKRYYRPDNCIFEYKGTASVDDVLRVLETFIPDLERHFFPEDKNLEKTIFISENLNEVPVPPIKTAKKVATEYLSQFSSEEYKIKLNNLHEWQSKKDIEKARRIMEPLAIAEYDIEIPAIDKKTILFIKQIYTRRSNKVPNVEFKIHKSSCSVFIKASEPFTKENYAEHLLMFYLRFYISRKMREDGKLYDIVNNYDTFNFRFELTVNRTEKPEIALQQIKSYLKSIEEYDFTNSHLLLVRTFIYSLFFTKDFSNVFFTSEIFNRDEKDLKSAASRFCKLIVSSN